MNSIAVAVEALGRAVANSGAMTADETREAFERLWSPEERARHSTVAVGCPVCGAPPRQGCYPGCP